MSDRGILSSLRYLFADFIGEDDDTPPYLPEGLPEPVGWRQAKAPSAATITPNLPASARSNSTRYGEASREQSVATQATCEVSP